MKVSGFATYAIVFQHFYVMNQLTQELIDKISSYLKKENLKNVLTLSNKFRYAAERYSGAFAKYDMIESNAAEFVTRYSSHRLLFVRAYI
jgi:predicted ATP-grasp superfamily ATP-dependent carboligase